MQYLSTSAFSEHDGCHSEDVFRRDDASSGASSDASLASRYSMRARWPALESIYPGLLTELERKLGGQSQSVHQGPQR